jgi:hypothetical protein
MTAVNVRAIFDSMYEALDDHPIEEDWPYQEQPEPPRALSHREQLEVQLDAAEFVYRRYGYRGAYEHLQVEIEQLRGELGLDNNDAGEGRG